MSPWLFLLLSVVGLALTINVLRPTARGGVLPVASFVSGWLTGELTLHLIAVQVVVTLIFSSYGAFDAPAGQVGLALTGISWLGSLYAYSLSWRAQERIEAALTDALGARYRDQIDPEIKSHYPHQLNWRSILLPFSPSLPGVEVLRDIQFTSGSGIDVKLDIYRPAPGRDSHLSNPEEGRPVLLQIHGGGWTLNMGDKRHQGLPLMNQMAAHGWICVTADYRLSPPATFPEHIIDVKHAIRWIREEGAAFGMNSDFIVITGGSAGGHLSALAALTANDPAFQPGFEEVDTSVYACVPFYGVYDFIDEHDQDPNDGLKKLLEKSVMKGSVEEKQKLYESASPIHRVTTTAPPFFAIHGDCDTLVPLRHARDLSARLGETSDQHAALAVIPGAQHAFDIFSSPRSQIVVNGVERYLGWIYSRYLSDRGELADPEATSRS